MEEEIRQELFKMQDVKYKEFDSKLSPNIDESNIIGVRNPDLRNYAKKLYASYKYEDIEIGEKHQEELMLKGMLIGLIKSPIDFVLKEVDSFVPKINGWAVCDTFCTCLKITKKYPKEMFTLVEKYLKSKKEFEIRFSIVMLLAHYINDEYIDRVLDIINSIKSKDYYVQMANAWAISVCLVKYYDKTVKFLKTCKIDDFTYNKGIQKAIESYRITDKQKDALRRMKR